jgi:hypothetical protein
MEHLVRSIGVMAFGVIGIFVWIGMSVRIEAKASPGGLRTPIRALEVAESADSVRGIIGDWSHPNRVKTRANIQAEFVLIVAYWLLFFGMSILLVRGHHSFAIALAIIGGICATATAGFDVVENVRIFKVLDATLAETTRGMVDSIR